jgi:ABC-type sugar transport system permease subunit
MLRTRPWVPYLYAAPVVALLGLVFGYPLVRVFDFSFRRIRGDSGPWIGLDNYRLVLDDPTFRQAVKHSATLLLAVPVMLVISVLVALVLYERMRGWRVYRSVLFIPFILAVPIVGIVASYMFQFNGVVNSALRSFGLESLEQDWIGTSDWALWTVMFVIIWREVGFGIVLFLARMLSLDEGPLEAAKIDGASWLQRVRFVILPEIKGAIELYLVIASITVVAWVFAYVWTITKGGPGDATAVVELYIYNQGLRNSLPGMASAVAVMLLGVTVVAIAVLFWVRSRSQEEVRV